MNTPFFTCIFALIFALTWVLKGYSQDTKTDSVVTENALLWRVSGNGLKAPSYLYGTIHAICPDDMVFPNKIGQSFTEAKQLYLEIDMDNKGAMLSAQMKSFMKDGQTLKKLLSETDYEKVNTFFKDSIGMDIGMLGKMKPLLLSALMYPKMMGCPKTVSYEEKFLKMAKEDDKKIFGLESVNEQMDALDAIPLAQQAKWLVESVDEYPKMKKMYADMIEFYKKEDIAGVAALMEQEEDMGMGEYEDNLLKNRNQNWIPVIEDACKKNQSFFAFGAAHLMGANGVINLLKKAGYKVEAVK